MSETPSTDKLASLLKRFQQQKRSAATEAPPSARADEIVRRAPTGPVPASYAQRRLWLLDRLEPGAATYNMPFPARLRGRLEVEALHHGLRTIVRRQGSLRTVFGLEDGLPVQRVEPYRPAAWPLPTIDLAALPAAAREALAERLVDAEANSPFDLERGPLFRMRLLRLGLDDHALLLDMHHIVSDGWSVGVFFRQLARLLAAPPGEREAALPELPAQYVDYTLWQRERLAGERLERQLAYWRERLGGELPTLELPMDRPRPPLQRHRGGTARALYPPSLVEALKTFGRERGASLFMVLLAGWKALLHRLSGETDVIVGTPTAGRLRLEVEDLIGLFLNSLALRTSLADDPSFAALVERVREAALGAAENQEVPFERLLEEIRPERHLSHSPVFQVFFNMINLPDQRFELPGLAVDILTPPTEGSKFDLTVYAEDTGDGLRLDLVYDADLFDAARVDEMLEQYRLLLERAIADPARRVGSIGLVTERARERLPDPAAPLSDAWRGSLPAGFDRRAAERPEHPAVVDAVESLSYGELRARSDRLARWLLASALGGGAAAGDVRTVAIWAERSAPLVWALLGVLKSGAAFVVLDPAYPTARLLDYLRLAEPLALLEVGDAPAPPAELLAALGDRPRLRLPRGAGAEAVDELAEHPATSPELSIEPQHPAYVAFTSGSTGEPKGVVGRHGSLTHFLPWLADAFALGQGDRHSLLSALAHDPLHRDVFMPLWYGATLVVPEDERIAAPGYLARWAREQRLTVLNLVPAMLQLLTQPLSAGEAVEPLDELRWVFTVGDVLTRRSVAELYRLSPSVTCVNYYGSTETQRAVGHTVLDREATLAPRGADKAALPLGRGIEGVQLLVLRPGAELRRCGVGEPGEIFVRSHHLALGYLGDEKLTAARFLDNPFAPPGERRDGDRLYRTGDLGRYLPNGEVEFLGRADHQVKVRGYRIELQEIERALEAHPEVLRAAVAVARTAAGDARLAAYAVPIAGASPRPAALRAHLAERLPDYMVPAAYGILERLPLSATGKLDRRALPPLAELETATGDDFVAPRNAEEEAIAAIWKRWLEVERVGVGDNFFDLGGHSLLATQVLAEIERQLGVAAPLRLLFEAPTVGALALAIDQQRALEVSDEDLAELLGEVEGLSDEELEALLAADEDEDEDPVHEEDRA